VKTIKKICSQIINSVLTIIGFGGRVAIVLIPIFCVAFLFFDDVGHCLDSGGVWDYDQKICRSDCLTWKKEYGGCIKLTPEQEACYQNNRYSLSKTTCIDTEQLFIICHNNNKAWNLDKQECMFEFTLQNCNKLSGNWLYPAGCNLNK